MKRKGPQKHSNEVIKAAIAKFEGGARLSAISRELGVVKSTVKYWLDNANRFIPESHGSPTTSRIQTRLTREAWDIIFLVLKEIKRKLPEASVRDLVAVMGELFDRQAQFGKAMGGDTVPEKILERSEELQVTVRRYLQGKEAGGAIPTAESLSAEGIKLNETTKAVEAEISPARPQKDETNAN